MNIITKTLNGTQYAIREDAWNNKKYHNLAFYSMDGVVVVKNVHNDKQVIVPDETIERLVDLANEDADELVEILMKNGMHITDILNF